MKTHLSLLAAALMLAACGPQTQPTQPQSAPPSTPAAPPAASEAAVSAVSAPAAASEASAASAAAVSPECAVEIISDDAMKFDPREIQIKSSCTQFSITLKHVGKMPKAAMGHNVVITKTADRSGVLEEGASAGVDSGYLKPNDSRVVAATKMLGGGESDTITFDVSKLAKGEAYEYFCSFPGHYANMNGKIVMID